MFEIHFIRLQVVKKLVLNYIPFLERHIYNLKVNLIKSLILQNRQSRTKLFSSIRLH